MAQLPSGTLTLLFSDIEGSTLLLSRLGEEYADALTRQRQALREAWARWGGHELGTEGDSFFVVFDVARNAVSAALDAQRALAATPWPQGERVRVRMGLHTGEPTRHEDGYVGMDVHRAARVAGIAHGGQVVVTDTTMALVRDGLPADVSLRDLGRHRLKDLAAPEHLFQVCAPGSDEDFPPLRSLGTSSSLPTPSTPLLGRAEDLASLVRRFAEEDLRLVTLTGPGGTGKTRLAIEAAAALAATYGDGVYFVPLASVTGADGLWASVADRLSLGEDRERVHVLAAVADRRVLLVLDNLEQLDGAATAVADLLGSGPGVAVLATSRRPLHLSGELEHAVAPLSVPDDDPAANSAGDSAAVALFCQRAAMVRRGFVLTEDNAADVAEVCRRLDGLPLAIELAAARCRLLTPAAVLARLPAALDATSTDADRPARQRSLRETIRWSCDLLDSELQEFLRCLGVFPGPASLAAVAHVTGWGDRALDAVESLADASLVRVLEGSDGEPRVGLLQTVRAFAREELAAADLLDDVHRRHAEHVAALVEETAPLLVTRHVLSAGDRLQEEHDQIRAALEWSLPDTGAPPGVSRGDRGRADLGRRICVALWWHWASQGHVASGTRWFRRALAQAPDEEGGVSARLYLGLGVWVMWRSDDEARSLLARAADFAEQIGDGGTVAEAASTLAQWYQEHDDEETAVAHFERGLAAAEAAGAELSLASVLHHYAWIVLQRGDPDRARAMIERALDISRRAGNERDVIGRRRDLADLLAETGHPAAARRAMAAVVPDVLRLREPAMYVEVIGSFASHARQLGEHRRFVVLAAARNLFHVQIGWPEGVLRGWESQMDLSRPVLGDAEWAAAIAEGRSMSMTEVLEYGAAPAE